jgi:hypothetical protein
MDNNAVAVRDNEQQLPATLAERKQQTDMIIDMATHWAKRLMEIVEKCGMSTNMGGKKYLEVEGWLMISEFAHVKPIVEWVRPWKEDDGHLLGYECRVKLVNDDGQEVGAGESSCGLDAFPCRGKQGSEKDKAAKSAAQTWATSRALRNKFSYVAKMAGYQAVPAEEMRGTSPEPPPQGKFMMTQGQLGKAILEYVNNDKTAAQQILMNLIGKNTCSGLSVSEATNAYKKFESVYLSAAPPVGMDDFPDWDKAHGDGN